VNLVRDREGAQREWVTAGQLHLWVVPEVGPRMGTPMCFSLETVLDWYSNILYPILEFGVSIGLLQ
jgi:hypothetical protein